MPKAYTTEAVLQKQGYKIIGKFPVDGPCPSQADKDQHGADSCFKAKDGEWYFCKN